MELDVYKGTFALLNPKPVNPKPVDPKPVNPKPVNPKPVNPKPVNPMPMFFKYRMEFDVDTGTITVGPGLLSNLQHFGDYMECPSTDPRCSASQKAVSRLGDFAYVPSGKGGVSAAAGGSSSRNPPDPSHPPAPPRTCGACGKSGI